MDCKVLVVDFGVESSALTLGSSRC